MKNKTEIMQQVLKILVSEIYKISFYKYFHIGKCTFKHSLFEGLSEGPS